MWKYAINKLSSAKDIAFNEINLGAFICTQMTEFHFIIGEHNIDIIIKNK